jgi:hypothetical protein
MKIFEALKKLRDFERINLPFVKAIIDFDIVIEIGYAEEQGRPLTLKRLFLLDISSRTTVRRRLAILIDEGVVVRAKQSSDHRMSVLTISSSSYKLFSKYVGTLSGIFSTILFKK